MDISEVKHVEKHGRTQVTIGVINNISNSNVDFKVRSVSGTGSAMFDDGMGGTTDTVTILGNGSLTANIIGITTSSSVDNIIIEAIHQGSVILDSENFSVAEITALEFSRVHDTPNTSNGNEASVALDNNPGIDGTHTAGEGQRIYPGRTSANNLTDRASVKVTATVAPSGISKADVYFASYDVDDPSSNMAPIDDESPSPINDNRGDVMVAGVGTSHSGIFVNPQGGSCQASSTNAHISKIYCTVSGSSAITHLRIPKSPGDNLAVAASLDETYRNGILIQTSSPLNLINSTNQVLHTSGSANPQNVQGIRTKMLTVWRKVHIERESMENVPAANATGANNVSGTISGNYTIGSGNTTLTLNGVNLELDRFENGRIEIGTGAGMRDFPVIDNNISSTPITIANTSNTVTITNPGATMNVTNLMPFTLYDDDDFNNDDGVNKDGDAGEDVTEPSIGLLQTSNTPCVDSYTTNNCNVFVSAYVMPTYDLATHINEVDFDLNTTPAELSTIVSGSDFGQRGTQAEPDYWTVYLLGAYQAQVSVDGDPNSGFDSMGQGFVTSGDWDESTQLMELEH